MIREFRLRRLVRAERYGRLALRQLSQSAGSPASLGWAMFRAAQVLRNGGPRALLARLREVDERPAAPSYAAWIERSDRLTPARLAALRAKVQALRDPPLISVLMPVYNPPPTFLEEAIASVRRQLYPNWELCIADDASTDRRVIDLLRATSSEDPRIKVIFRPANGHISEASNSALELVAGDWVALLDHDDLLRENALAEVALEIGQHPEAELIYSDEDKIDEEGHRYEPYFKPDFSPELFRSQNYLNHLTVHRTSNIRAVGGWRKGFEGSQDYDLNLRIFERVGERAIQHIPKVLYHWRAASTSTALRAGAKTYAFTAGLRALQEHLVRSGLEAVAQEAPGVPYYRIRMKAPSPPPLVSLIVPTRDRVDLLRRCLGSILTKTLYRPFEILVVDNGSSDPETLAYLREVSLAPNVRVLRYDRPFNYSAINNFAVARARGTIVGLVNNDIEAITPGWLAEMVSWAARPEIGCVGAKLYYENDTVQHAGVIVGLGGVAGHAHRYARREQFGYFGRLRVVQNFLAVTGACLLVRKAVYEEVGGLDAEGLAVAFNDVDFCLKVHRTGYRNVWTPYAELYHLESVSRGADTSGPARLRFEAEVRLMKERWNIGKFLDPYYSPNLTMDMEDFSFPTA